jgi:hypothetical protein
MSLVPMGEIVREVLLRAGEGLAEAVRRAHPGADVRVRAVADGVEIGTGDARLVAMTHGTKASPPRAVLGDLAAVHEAGIVRDVVEAVRGR